jgi:transposase
MFAGVDTHKDSLAVAVIDHAGRVVRQLELPNQVSGYARLLALLSSHNVVRVGVEGSGNFGWPAAIYLLERNLNVVVEVPPLMTSRERLSRPGQGKTDPVDAVAIARITAREESLPPVRPMTGQAADLRVLTEYRDQLVNERTATADRVHTDLLWLRPGYQHQLPHLTNTAHLHAAPELLNGDDSVTAAVSGKRLRCGHESTCALHNPLQVCEYPGRNSWVGCQTCEASGSLPNGQPASGLPL